MSASRSILLVEDEPLIAMMLEDFLESMGHRIAGTADCVADALVRVEAGGFDVAILDVHLKDGEHSWPIADALAARSVPFILSTGGHTEPPPAAYADCPVLAKPFTIDAIEPALDRVCGE